jgi:hypothetical protein
MPGSVRTAHPTLVVGGDLRGNRCPETHFPGIEAQEGGYPPRAVIPGHDRESRAVCDWIDWNLKAPAEVETPMGLFSVKEFQNLSLVP